MTLRRITATRKHAAHCSPVIEILARLVVVLAMGTGFYPETLSNYLSHSPSTLEHSIGN